jgi:hypothetical protein
MDGPFSLPIACAERTNVPSVAAGTITLLRLDITPAPGNAGDAVLPAQPSLDGRAQSKGEWLNI